MEGKQKLFYLPEPHTDFIFAVTAEEIGLIGSILVVTLFGVFAFRGLRMAYRTQDSYRAAAGDGAYVDHRDPGAVQYQRGAGAAADEGNPVAVHLLWGNVGGGDAGDGGRAAGDLKADGVTMRALIVGGGTGGHVIPAVAIARALKEQYGAECLFVGTRGGWKRHWYRKRDSSCG